MSIIRIVEGEYKTEIEGSWTVYTDEFHASAGQSSYFTAGEGTVFGNPEKDDKDKETTYFKEGWWSSDAEGNKKITEANIGATVYFHIKTQNIADKDPHTKMDSHISIQLYNYNSTQLHGYNGVDDDPIQIISGAEGIQIVSRQVKGNKAALPLELKQGLEFVARTENEDDLKLFFRCSYQQDFMIPLPKDKAAYLSVKTCDKKVVQSYKSAGYGKCAFYQFRYNDFMSRHKNCWHVPPDYYYGPMLKMNDDTEDFYNMFALTDEMKSAAGMTVARIKPERRLGVACKPLPSYSYGFKYCVRFTHVLSPKLSTDGKTWLSNARFRLQELMEIGLLEYKYEAKYDKIIKSMESTFNKNFEPTQKESIAAGSYAAAKAIKKKNYYKNIELMNRRFKEFAFATHPDAYDPKRMSALPVKDLALITLSPDFKEWIGEGAHDTWLQAAIVAGNMDYGTLIGTNIDYYYGGEGSFWGDVWDVTKETGKKIEKEFIDVLLSKDMAQFVKSNSIKNVE